MTRSNALHVLKTQSGHWQTKGLKVASRGYVGDQAARGQLEYTPHLFMLKDLIEGVAPGSTLLINDFLAGVGELGVAAVHARASQEAKDAGVTISYLGVRAEENIAGDCEGEHQHHDWGNVSRSAVDSRQTHASAGSSRCCHAGRWRHRRTKQRNDSRGIG